MAREDEPTMIPVRLSRIVVRDDSEQQWIFLTEVDGSRGFPIVIGTNEAHATKTSVRSRSRTSQIRCECFVSSTSLPSPHRRPLR